MGKRATKGAGPDGMKACYREAKAKGDREEEARWANQIGHAYKDKGDYVDALTWFRLDYDISVKRGGEDGGPRLNLMPTCQSLGEIYLRLGDYKEALHYQERHLELAVEANERVEQQRAHTQLGRTYQEIYELQEKVDALPKSKAHFDKAMVLAESLKANPVPGSSNFVAELVDAYNNLGMLKMITDEPREARRLLQQGLKICDEEEVGQNDATRTRLHHNLGRLYTEKRQWGLAMTNVMKDIEICQAIPHPQGEVKGLINLADIHFKQRQYTDAIRCYNIAHEIVRKLQDEDALMTQVQANKEVVEAAITKLAAFNVGLGKHKEMQTKVDAGRGKASERSLFLQEFKFLKGLIGQAYELQYWEEHLKLAKRLKEVVDVLGDQEKMGDVLDVVGESYLNLCNYEEAKKWYYESFKVCQRVHHEEGQAVALINYGNALDSCGDYKGALKAYQQAYDIMKQTGDTRLLAQKINALDNMHYCYVVRFNQPEDARIVEDELKMLKQLKEQCQNEEDSDARCSETDDEAERESEAEDMDTDAQEVLARTPLMDSTNTAQKSCSQRKKPEVPPYVVRRSHVPDVRKRVRMVLSDEDSEVSAGTMCPRSPQKRLSRASVKTANASKVRTPSSIGRKSKRPETDALNLSSDDDDELLETVLKASTSNARKKKSTPKHIQLQVNSKARNRSAGIENGSLQKSPPGRLAGGWTLTRLLNVGNPSHETFNDDSQLEDLQEYVCEGRLHKNPPQRRLAPCVELEDVEERSGGSVARSMSKTVASGRNMGDLSGRIKACPTKADLDCEVVRDPPSFEPQHHATGSRRQARKSISSHHDGSASHNSDAHAHFNLTQPPLIVPVNINGQTLRVIIRRSEMDTNKTVDWLIEEIIRLYTSDSSTGKKPVVQRLEFKGSTLKPVQIIEEVLVDLTPEDSLEAIVQGWVTIPLVERYEAHCIAANVSVNPTLVTKLKLLKGSYEEVDASCCDLQDVSVRPLITALQDSDALSSLDLSHNLLGNATMSAIQEMIAATNQCDLGLTLDLHNNQLGAGALMQIAKCTVTLSRMEVLKLSGNRLTDAAARNLASILAQSKALATLEIESCGLTTRTIQQISTSLQPESSLVKLSIGHNNPIAGTALSILFQKLSVLVSFAELDIRGIELDEKGVSATTKLMKSSSSLSAINMAGCDIQNHGAQVMCSEMVGTSPQLLHLDLSSCGLSRDPALKICQQVISIHGLSTLDLSNNQFDGQAAEILALALRQEGCRLKSLCLNNCHIGQNGILNLLQSLQGNSFLWELHIAGNFELSSTESPAVNLSLQSTPHTEGELVNETTKQIQEPSSSALNEAHGSGVSRTESANVENEKDDASLKSLGPISDAIGHNYIEEPKSGPRLEDLAQKVSDDIDLSFNKTLEIEGAQGDVGIVSLHERGNYDDLLDEATQLENEPIKVSEDVNKADVDIARAEEVSADRNSTQIGSHVIEELVNRIMMAHGLQCLNMTGNGLNSEDLKRLWEAWGHEGRSAKTQFQDKAHFLVQDGRECSALTTSCLNCQPRT